MLTEHQLEIIERVKNSSKENIVIQGSAGVGKTFIIPHIINCFLPAKVGCYAPTHKALSVLESKVKPHVSKVEYKTVHGLLKYRPVKNRKTGEIEFKSFLTETPKVDILIVDEASMLSQQMIDDLEKTFKRSKIIFIGDDKQLPPINFDTSPIFKKKNKVFLTEIIRQAKDSPIITLSNSVEKLWKEKLKTELHDGKGCHVITKSEEYLSKFLNRENYSDIVYLAYNVKLVEAFNRDIIRRKYPSEGYIKIHKNETMIVGTTLYNEDRPTCQNNDEFKIKDYKIDFIDINLYTYNDKDGKTNIQEFSIRLKYYLVEGTIKGEARALPVLHEESDFAYEQYVRQIRASYRAKNRLPKKEQYDVEKHLAKNTLQESFVTLNYSYASTVHKSQGSTFKEILLGYRNIKKEKELLRRKLFYTAITRASDNIYILQL